MDTKGGRFTLTINGRTFSGRGQGKVKPSRVSRKNGANQDGTGWSSTEAQLASLELSFDRGVGLKWDEELMLQVINVTFVETDANRTHLFTDANWEGEPEIETGSGEVTGLSIKTDKYQAL